MDSDRLTNSHERRHDLDWLRIGLFLLLILYHVGMFYVPWSWHVKSAYAPFEALEVPMRLLNPWRIPALFVISGIALRFALDKAANHYGFLPKRFIRLFLPILFGMFVICAPQAYLELKQKGVETGNMVQYYLGYISFPWASPEYWDTITPTWNHLWYLVYVLLMSMIIILLSAVTHRSVEHKLEHLLNRVNTRPVVFILIPIVASLIILFVFQNSVGSVQMVWGDWHGLASALWLMLFGFAIAKHANSWTILWRSRWILFLIAIALGALLTMVNLDWFWVGSEHDLHYYTVRSIYSSVVILMLLGFVQMLGRGSDKIRRYLSDAVFPYYVLHQTVIIILGVWLTQFELGLAQEAILLIVVTASLTAALYEFIIRRMGWAAILLGGR